MHHSNSDLLRLLAPVELPTFLPAETSTACFMALKARVKFPKLLLKDVRNTTNSAVLLFCMPTDGGRGGRFKSELWEGVAGSQFSSPSAARQICARRAPAFPPVLKRPNDLLKPLDPPGLVASACAGATGSSWSRIRATNCGSFSGVGALIGVREQLLGGLLDFRAGKCIASVSFSSPQSGVSN